MNPDIKVLWLKWLRSGKYRQARRKLVTDSGKSFCCLGVLQNIAIEQGVYDNLSVDPDWSGGKCDDVTHKWAGITSRISTDLAVLNDGDPWRSTPLEGVSFKKIADWIEENL